MATIFLLGNLRASLTLARSLSRAGHRIIAGMDEPDPYLFLSRHVDQMVPHAPLDEHPEAALKAIIPALGRHEVDILLPVSEVATRLVAAQHDRLRLHAGLAMPDSTVVAACADKAALFDACDVAGVPLAPRRIVSSVDALLAAVEDISGPLIIKPTDSAAYVLGHKALRFDDPVEVRAAFTAWPSDHRTLCVQRFVNGPRVNVYFAAQKGALLGAVPVQVTRTDAIDGTGYAVAGRSIEASSALRDAVETLIDHLDYHGVGCAQFMQSADRSSLSFLEINPRLGGNFKIAEACGLPLSQLSIELPMGNAVAGLADPWATRHGVRYAWTKGAISGALKARRSGQVGWAGCARLLAAAMYEVFSPCHLSLDLRGPAPTLGSYANILLGKSMARRWAPTDLEPDTIKS